MHQLSRILLIIGGLDLGIIGLGNFIGKDLNVIALFHQFTPMLPTIIYLIIGGAAIFSIFRRY